MTIFACRAACSVRKKIGGLYSVTTKLGAYFCILKGLLLLIFLLFYTIVYWIRTLLFLIVGGWVVIFDEGGLWCLLFVLIRHGEEGATSLHAELERLGFIR